MEDFTLKYVAADSVAACKTFNVYIEYALEVVIIEVIVEADCANKEF